MGFVQLAIDIGTSYTSIYQKGVGLVLREPSVVVCQNGVEARGIRAIGIEAKKMIGKTPENTTVIFPIYEGAIVNSHIASIMLDFFLHKIYPNRLLKPKIKALINLPLGLNLQEKKVFENMVASAGVREAFFIEAPVAAAFGMEVPMTKSEPCMVIDIGGGTTDIGVLNHSGMITGCSAGIGGNNIDTAIIDYLTVSKSLKVGLISTERAKIEAGSLYVNDTTTFIINGRDISLGSTQSRIISSKDLIGTVETYYGKITSLAESVIQSLPEEVAIDVKRKGIYVCGGASQIAGLKQFMSSRLKTDINVAPVPTTATILGVGKLLADPPLMNNFL